MHKFFGRNINTISVQQSLSNKSGPESAEKGSRGMASPEKGSGLKSAEKGSRGMSSPEKGSGLKSAEEGSRSMSSPEKESCPESAEKGSRSMASPEKEMLRVTDLGVSFYGNAEVVKGVSFSLKEGSWLMIAGPNGAGKSTIINAISGSTAYTGEILVGGRPVSSFKPSDLAREVGVLAQNHSVSYAYTVREVVNLGRYSYAPGLFGGGDAGGRGAIDEAVALTGIEGILDQNVMTLSGGELQRTFLAQLLAQNPKILMLDEPTNHLDLKYQKQLFEIMTNWLKVPGRAILAVVHDLSLVRRFGTDVLLLNKGSVVSYGTPDEVLRPDSLAEIYEMDVYNWMNTMFSQWK